MSNSDCGYRYNPISSLSEDYDIWSIAVSQDGRIIACLRDTGISNLYAIPTVWDRKENIKITTHKLIGFEGESVVSEFSSLALWPDQNHTLLIGRDRQPNEITYEHKQVFRNWEIGSSIYGFPYLDILASMEINIDSFVISEDTNFIAIQSDKGLNIIHTLTHELKKVADDKSSGSWPRFMPTMQFSPNNKLFAFKIGGHLGIFDLEKNILFETFEAVQKIVFPKYTPGIYDEQWPLAFSPDGLHLVTRDSSGRLFIWKTTPFDIQNNIIAPSDTQKFISAQYSPDGKVLVLGMNDGSLSFWDPISYLLIEHKFNIHDGDVHTIKFSHDGSEMFTAGGKNVTIWKKNITWGHHSSQTG